MEQNLNVERALQLILENIKVLPPEKLSIMDANGRVLAEEVIADHDLPPGPQSAVDGFALGNSRASINSCYELKGFLQLGDYTKIPLQNNEALGIMTGGSIPAGTQSVVPHEKTRLNGKCLIVAEEIKTGSNIKQAGEDFYQGENLIASKTKLDAGHIGLLAAFGHNKISVYSRPRVGLLSLGRNVVNCSQNPKPGQTRDSNTPFLAASITQAGGHIVDSKYASQAANMDFLKCLDELKQQSDLLIISGGTYSENEAEALQLLESAGARMVYWGTSIQPGSHNGFAVYESVPIFALSGNPAACAVGFHLFAAPALHYMQGLPFALKKVKARCTNDFRKTAQSHRFVRGRAQCTEEGWEVCILPGQKPSMLRSLINCNALIDMPAGHLPLESGLEVNVILLETEPFPLCEGRKPQNVYLQEVSEQWQTIKKSSRLTKMFPAG